MSSHNQAQSEMPTVQSFLGIPDQIQGEKIADQFGEISHLYEPLKTEDISLEEITNNKPCMEPFFVHQKIKKMKSNCVWRHPN